MKYWDKKRKKLADSESVMRKIRGPDSGVKTIRVDVYDLVSLLEARNITDAPSVASVVVSIIAEGGA